jgi:hypothetical protein
MSYDDLKQEARPTYWVDGQLYWDCPRCGTPTPRKLGNWGQSLCKPCRRQRRQEIIERRRQQTIGTDQRYCTKCQQVKPIQDFVPPDRPDRLRATCDSCRRRAMQNKEKQDPFGNLPTAPPPFPGEERLRGEGRCATVGERWWFEPEHYQRAVEVCRTCLVQDLCRRVADHVELHLFGKRWSMDRRVITGVWGGETPEQRARRRRAATRGRRWAEGDD